MHVDEPRVDGKYIKHINLRAQQTVNTEPRTLNTEHHSQIFIFEQYAIYSIRSLFTIHPSLFVFVKALGAPKQRLNNIIIIFHFGTLNILHVIV